MSRGKNEAARRRPPAELPVPLPFDDDDDQLALTSIPAIDPKTGRAIDVKERQFRARIMAESAQGFVAVDRRYHEAELLIHQPLVVDDVGEFVDDSWQLQRSNSTVLRVTPGQIGDVSLVEHDIEAMQEFGVMVARKAVGDAAARLMRILYEMANDPPNWRTRQITVRLTDLMDHMAYRKDANGYHRTKNRRHLGQTLLALQYTHIGIQRSGKGGSAGAMGPLLAGLEFTTNEDTTNITVFDVFKRGLPDVVTIVINEMWYRIRDSNGRPTSDYALVPRMAPLRLPDGATLGRRPNPALVLRAYFADAFERETSGRLVITRDALRNVAGIKDTHVTRSTRTLTRVLQDLQAEGVIGSFEPGVLPLDPDATVTFTAPAPVPAADGVRAASA